MGTDTHPAAGACALKEAAAHAGALSQFLKDWIPQEGAHAGAMEECREKRGEKRFGSDSLRPSLGRQTEMKPQ